MSILELVKEAEVIAEEKKAQATKQANELFEKAKQESEDEVKRLFSEFNETQNFIDNKYDEIIKIKEKEIINKYKSKDEEAKELAALRKTTTVDYIIRKVFEA